MTSGLGVMGYGMAINLRSKLDKGTTFYICDVSTEAIDRFKAEMQGCGPIELVKNGAEAVQVAVSHLKSQVSYPH